jgi:transcriptional regulator with XRE-family HTH domain
MIAPWYGYIPAVDMFALIGETLRRLRKEKGLTLERLGEAAELGRGQLSRIENSRQEATLSTLAKILTSQGVSRREFFRRYDLVESEALGVERQQTGAAATGEGPWPQGILDAVSRVEAFIQATLQQAHPVAQGASATWWCSSGSCRRTPSPPRQRPARRRLRRSRRSPASVAPPPLAAAEPRLFDERQAKVLIYATSFFSPIRLPQKRSPVRPSVA